MSHSNTLGTITKSVQKAVQKAGSAIDDNVRREVVDRGARFGDTYVGKLVGNAANASTLGLAGAIATGKAPTLKSWATSVGDAATLDLRTGIPAAIKALSGKSDQPGSVTDPTASAAPDVDPAALMALRRQRLLSAYGRQATILSDPAGGSNSLGTSSGKTSLGL